MTKPPVPLASMYMISWLLVALGGNGGTIIRLAFPLTNAFGAPAPNDFEEAGEEVPGLRVPPPPPPPPPPPAPGLGAAGGGAPGFWKKAVTNETGCSAGESGETRA